MKSVTLRGGGGNWSIMGGEEGPGWSINREVEHGWSINEEVG